MLTKFHLLIFLKNIIITKIQSTLALMRFEYVTNRLAIGTPISKNIENTQFCSKFNSDERHSRRFIKKPK